MPTVDSCIGGPRHNTISNESQYSYTRGRNYKPVYQVSADNFISALNKRTFIHF